MFSCRSKQDRRLGGAGLGMVIASFLMESQATVPNDLRRKDQPISSSRISSHLSNPRCVRTDSQQSLTRSPLGCLTILRKLLIDNIELLTVDFSITSRHKDTKTLLEASMTMKQLIKTLKACDYSIQKSKGLNEEKVMLMSHH